MEEHTRNGHILSLVGIIDKIFLIRAESDYRKFILNGPLSAGVAAKSSIFQQNVSIIMKFTSIVVNYYQSSPISRVVGYWESRAELDYD